MKISKTATIATMMLVSASISSIAQANEGPYELNGRNVFEISRDVKKDSMAQTEAKQTKTTTAVTKKMMKKTKSRAIDRIGFSKKY